MPIPTKPSPSEGNRPGLPEELVLAGGEKAKAKEAEALPETTVEAFARHWYAEIAEPSNSNPRNIKRVLEKDVIPAIGSKQIADVTVSDVLAITDKIKARGADQMALQTRNVLKRLFAYAIAREKATSTRLQQWKQSSSPAPRAATWR
jgi:predicted P-loop ATPase/GTPase